MKSLTNFLTQDYSFNQLIRIEKAINLLIKGKIHKKLFVDALVKKYDEGGVGIDRKVAEHMASVSVSLVQQSVDVKRFRSDNESDVAFFAQHKFAERVRAYLLEYHHIPLSKAMEINLTTMIADRLSGIHGEKEFHNQLLATQKQGGLHLEEKIAEELSRYMEKLISLGIDVSYKA